MTTQQVNLYQPALDGGALALSPPQMGQVAAGVALLFIAISLWLLASSWGDRRLLRQLEAELGTLEVHVSGLEAKVNSHLDATGLDAQLAQLRAELKAKREVMRILTDARISNALGFSVHLRGLSERHVDGVWLRSFAFDDGGQVVTLEGSALRAELIPRLLQQLRTESAFRGREFESFELHRSDVRPSAIDFRVSNAQEVDG